MIELLLALVLVGPFLVLMGWTVVAFVRRRKARARRSRSIY